MSRREELLDAAIAVLGAQGVRHLTHRAVDAHAGLPAGSASNHFRSRDALLAAVIGRFAERERAAWEAIAGQPRPATPDELARALALFLRRATGPDRALTLARFALFVEVGLRPGLQGTLADTAAEIRGWGARWLAAVGSREPERDCQLVLNHLDGMLLHRVAFPDAAGDPLPELSALLSALLPAADPGGRREPDGVAG
jgi:AcrR family transcriptional regulator